MYLFSEQPLYVLPICQQRVFNHLKYNKCNMLTYYLQVRISMLFHLYIHICYAECIETLLNPYFDILFLQKLFETLKLTL